MPELTLPTPALTASEPVKALQTCPICHNLDRSKIIYWKGGPSRHKMFLRYYQSSDYHSVPVPLKDLKFSASRECPFCVIVFDIFRWLARTKAAGLNAIYQAKVELCVPFNPKLPVVLTYCWLPLPGARIPRQYDFQISVPSQCLSLPWSILNVGQQIPKDPWLGRFRPRMWLQNCLQHHDKSRCRSSPDGAALSMPKRLLFLGAANNDSYQNQIRLMDGFDGEHVPYIALSYCWGSSKHVITKTTNYYQHLEKLPWATLPATYRDAIKFTRAVGYRYLWIDALCIIQDDNGDWSSEASHMADIYSQAILVISAANANHVGFGFLQERPGSREFKNRLRRRPEEPTHVLVQEPAVHSNISGDFASEGTLPLFRRAWTLQERLLATRILHFTAAEMVWECASTSLCECGHLETTNTVTSRRLYDLSSCDPTTDTERAKVWDHLALSYQHRSLTNDRDRLPALSGLAHRFQNDGLGHYLAGLWSNFAISMMLWEVKKGRRASEYVAPSWSWASIQGRLKREDPIQPNSVFQAVLLDSGCAYAAGDVYGAIVPGSAYVTISSPCLDGTIIRSERNGHPIICLTPRIHAFLESDAHVDASQFGAMVKCVLPRGLEEGPSGRYIEALVLRLSKNLKDYQRIGIAHINKYTLQELQNPDEGLRPIIETIKII